MTRAKRILIASVPEFPPRVSGTSGVYGSPVGVRVLVEGDDGEMIDISHMVESVRLESGAEPPCEVLLRAHWDTLPAGSA